jgi:dTDP-4-dehydrorhamnose reductase
VRILGGAGEGLYHVSAAGGCSWFEFARAILDGTGRADVPIEPIGSDSLDRPAPRPRNAVLRNMHLELTIGDGMPSWSDGLRTYLAEREADA